MSLQKIFDTVATHLLKQGCRAENPAKGCMYRDPKGRKCAAGALISDGLYARFNPDGDLFDTGPKKWERYNSLEGTTVGALPATVMREMVGTGDDAYGSIRLTGLIGELQTIHDGDAPSLWVKKLRELAINRGLSTAVLDRLDAVPA
jgi:hypothetical protein